MSSSYRNTLNEWLSNLDVKANTVLDIGGSQETMPKRVKSWNVENYIIADLPQPHKDSPKPDIEMDINKTLEPVNDPYNDFADYFDSIFCLEVFDYVYDPMTAFRNIELLLKKGGTAWVTFPSFYPTHQPIEDDSLRYMEYGIRKLAKGAGLTIEEMIKRRPESNMLDQFIRTERLRAAKNYDHEFLGWIVRFSK